SPACPEPTLPLNLSGRRRIAEDRVRTVIPLPLTLTDTFAARTWPLLLLLVWPECPWPEPPRPAPPDAAYTMPGPASAVAPAANRATACALTRQLTSDGWSLHVVPTG